MSKIRFVFCVLTTGLCWMAGWSSAASGDDQPRPPEVTEVQVFPTALELKGIRDARRLLVTGKTADGQQIDLSADAKLEAAGAAVTIDDGFVTPHAVGAANVKVTVAGKMIPVAVNVLEAAPVPVSFIREVLPIISKVGCNAGACHGGQQGKAGFKLSLRGYDPQYDYNALIDDLAGRRFNRSSPEQSLMLLKPTQGVPHEGGFLFDENSRAYRLIHQWIAEGCQFDVATRVARLEVFPQGILLNKPGSKQSHVVIAHYDDGASRDVTREAIYETSNFEVAVVNGAGDVEAVRRGEANVLIRYEGAYTTNVVMVLGNRAGYEWIEVPEYNFVDTLVNQKLKRMKIQPAGLCSDGDFVRRIYFDLTGIPPTADQVREFLADPRASKVKRDAKIEELLASPGFIDHWTLKWSDLLLSNRKFISEKGVWAFRNWIRNSLATNLPYDKFVYQLITANGSTFENPAANYYRIAREPKLVMENMTQLFIGTRFMCNQCHDHPFERWTQNQYYELSAFFAAVGRKPGLVNEEEVIFTLPSPQPVTNPRTNVAVPAAFPYTHPGVDSTLTDLREQVGQWLTAKENPYFAKSLVNRYWSYLLGRGIIDPVDDIRASNPPSNAELLQALTDDFIKQGFDLKQLVRTIVSSQTYQRSIDTNKWNQDDSVNYSHASPRRLGAEQLYDAIMLATGSPSSIPGVPAGFRATQLPDGKIDLSFLDMFGRPPRESPCECERTSEVSLAQTLNLINGPTIGDAIAHPQGLVARLVAEKADSKKLVEEVYLSVLCRQPTPEEAKQGEAYLSSVQNPAEGAQDLMWALINSPAFLFNR
jgi:hypothetical protein